MEIERAERIAKAIIEKLEPYCERVEVAGSIRRRKPDPRDVDIVLIPKDLWNLHNEIMGLCKPFPATMSGKKIMRIKVNGTQIDFYFADETTRATLLLIRTGSVENNIRLCGIAKKKGWHLAASGDGLFDENGVRIAGNTEQSIYAALGLQYQEPPERG